MMIETLLIMSVIGASCSLVGCLLVLKQNVMVADAISHTVLLGIVLAFFIVPDLDSPFLVFGATVFGVLTALAIEGLAKTKQLQHDAAIGLVFPAFFALAVLLISKFFRNVHLDTDMVLLGEIVFAPLNQVKVFGISMPKALLQGSLLLIVNLSFILVFYRQLKLRLFDETFARSLGIWVGLLDLSLMVLVSLTSVISFQSVGAILVISLIIAPALTAQCLAHSLPQLLLYALSFAVLNSLLGYFIAIQLNVSISGMVATTSFITFMVILLGKSFLIKIRTHA